MLLVIGQVSDSKYVVFDTSEEAIGYGTQHKEYTLSELEELSNSGKFIGGYSKKFVKVYKSLHEYLKRQKMAYKLANSPLANFDYTLAGDCRITMYYEGGSDSNLEIDKLVIPKFVECLDFGLTDYRTMNIRSLMLNDGLQQICSKCFYEVGYLETVVIPDSVECIASSAFLGSSTLKRLVLGSGVTSVDSNAFRACNLQSVVFKESNNELFIGSHAFAYNSGLKELVLNREICSIGVTSFHKSTVLLPMDMQNYLKRKCTF